MQKVAAPWLAALKWKQVMKCSETGKACVHFDEL